MPADRLGDRVTRRRRVDAGLAPFAGLDNAASIAVMKRIGLARRGEFGHPRLPPAQRPYRHGLDAQERAHERAKEGR